MSASTIGGLDEPSAQHPKPIAGVVDIELVDHRAAVVDDARGVRLGGPVHCTEAFGGVGDGPVEPTSASTASRLPTP